MAAALIPLAISAAPQIIDLITALVHRFAPQAEAKLGAGTGPVKFSQVQADVMVELQRAAAAGQIPKNLPDDATINAIIQSTVTSLKLTGTLSTGGLAPVPSGNQPLVLAPGQTITIVVAVK